MAIFERKQQLKITILGSGTSQGVPVIACDCEVCQSVDPKDNRLRSAILVSHQDIQLVVDTGPDFRQQMLREKVQFLDAVFFTHMHKDHLSGLDDVRSFNFKQDMDMPIYCDEIVEEALHREFGYAFTSNYPGIPRLAVNVIDKDFTQDFGSLSIQALEVTHHNLPVLAYRFNQFGYVTDAKHISMDEADKLKGVEVLVVNALRFEEHISHFNIEEALAFIDYVKPKKAYLTHISHLMGLHETVTKQLPENVELAYDGLIIELED